MEPNKKLYRRKLYKGGHSGQENSLSLKYSFSRLLHCNG